MPILLNDPRDFQAAYGLGLTATLKKCEPGFRAWAYATQNLVYQEMVGQAPHRSHVICMATWRPDHTGSVRWVNGIWEWHAHWSEIKNGRSSDHFVDCEWHVVKLEDINGLYAALHDYTRPGGARDWILKGRSSDRFLVLNSEEPNMNSSRLYKKVADSTLRVVAKIDDSRWADLRSFGTHAKRKIVFNAVRGPRRRAGRQGKVRPGLRRAVDRPGYR